MKQKEVEVGGYYMADVGGEKVEVIVAGPASVPIVGRVREFPVKRADNGNRLPKGRTAAALHPIPADRVLKWAVKRILDSLWCLGYVERGSKVVVAYYDSDPHGDHAARADGIPSLETIESNDPEPRTLVRVRIGGKECEVANPKHVFSYRKFG